MRAVDNVPGLGLVLWPSSAGIQCKLSQRKKTGGVS